MAADQFAFFFSHPHVASIISTEIRKIRHWLDFPPRAIAVAQIADIMRISQNSSAFGYMRCAISMRRERPPTANIRFAVQQRSGLCAIIFARTTASALLTKRNSFTTPRFRPT
jgi:hypothetical protein